LAEAKEDRRFAKLLAGSPTTSGFEEPETEEEISSDDEGNEDTDADVAPMGYPTQD
jgi:hypothetical protein